MLASLRSITNCFLKLLTIGCYKKKVWIEVFNFYLISIINDHRTVTNLLRASITYCTWKNSLKPLNTHCDILIAIEWIILKDWLLCLSGITKSRHSKLYFLSITSSPTSYLCLQLFLDHLHYTQIHLPHFISINQPSQTQICWN